MSTPSSRVPKADLRVERGLGGEAPTPRSLDFRMPAEWGPHAATWLAWPYNLETWEDHLEGAEEVFVRFIEILTKGEVVRLLVPNAEVEQRARGKLKFLHIPEDKLHYHTIETGDVWFRDFGPLFIVRKKENEHVMLSGVPSEAAKRLRRGTESKHEVAWTKWRYNALGNKWEDLLISDTVPEKMPLGGLRRFDAGMVLEGGSVEVNGEGSLLTTEQCLLNENRNPDLAREEIEERLRDFLGVKNILWLKGGIAGDDTDGHVDDVTRFVGANTIVTVVEGDRTDENFEVLTENLRRLRRMKDERGQPFRIVPLPMPRPFSLDDRRMAASYANFYIANAAVIVPTYAQPSDEVALRTLQELFSDRPIVGLDCRELIFGYGALHCITQQEPGSH